MFYNLEFSIFLLNSPSAQMTLMWFNGKSSFVYMLSSIYWAYTSENSPWRIFSGTTIHSQDIWMPCNSSQNIYYENTSIADNGYLSQIGFIDSI